MGTSHYLRERHFPTLYPGVAHRSSSRKKKTHGNRTHAQDLLGNGLGQANQDGRSSSDELPHHARVFVLENVTVEHQRHR